MFDIYHKPLSAVGGGSGSGFSGYSGGNSGATNTIVASNGSIQEFTLNANTVFTLPDPNPAGGTAYYLELHLTQDATGSRIPTFTVSGGDPVVWDYGVAPSAINFQTFPGAVNIVIFELLNDRVVAHFRNPTDSSLIQVGGAAVQRKISSFLGQSTVSKRGPLSVIEGEVTTTDATLTVIANISVPVNSGLHITGDIFCLKSDGSSAGVFKIVSGSRRATGNVTEVGAEAVVVGVEDDAGTPVVTVTMDTSNQFVQINVTGVAATTFYWVAYLKYFRVII